MNAVDEVFDQRIELQSIEVICAIGNAAVWELEDWLGEPAPDCENATPELLAQLNWDREKDLEAGVRFILDNPAATLAAQHEAWKERNRARLKPDDPRLVPFDQLPFGQQLKARLWRHIVHAIIG